MKALNYLQMWHLTTFDAIKYNDWLFTLYNEHSNLSDWAYFLAQPFKPEMITEYFEGWRKVSEYHYYCREQHKEIAFLQDDANGQAIPSITEYSLYEPANIHNFHRNKLPRTLDEFITDCQKAGIVLNLKEQK